MSDDSKELAKNIFDHLMEKRSFKSEWLVTSEYEKSSLFSEIEEYCLFAIDAARHDEKEKTVKKLINCINESIKV